MDLGGSADQFDSDDRVPVGAIEVPFPLASAEFLTTALSQAGVGTWQVDMRTGLSTWDSVTSMILGLPALPMTVGDALPIHPDDRDRVSDRLEQHAAQGGSEEIEFRAIRADGEVRWLLAIGRRLDDVGAVGAHVAGIVRDITDQREAAESLREAEERYRLVTQVTVDLIFDWDIAADRLTWNEARGGFFGYTSADLSSMSALRYKIHPDDRDRVVEEFRQFFEGNEGRYTSDHRFERADGGFSDVHASGCLIRNEAGQPVRMIGSIQDVTERRYADAALRESEAINRGIVEASNDTVVLLDLDGKLLFLNRSGGLTTDMEDLAAGFGKHWTALWPDYAWPQINDAIRTAAAGGKAQLTESFVHESQLRWWELLVSPIFDDAGKPIKLVAIARDITQHREADEKLHRAATYDGLTDLPNRASFQDRLADAIDRACKTGRRIGLLLLDVDDFKQVNDSLGHDAGDTLLKSIASRLDLPSARPRAVARLGGDEFAVLLEGVQDKAELTTYAALILDRMKEPLVHGGRVLDCNVTIGAALFPDHGQTVDEVLKSADIALYVAKDSARGSVTTFEPRQRAGLQERATMVAVARSALQDHRVEAYYQPKVALRDHTIKGFEALLRWRDPAAGVHLPATIAAAFEDLEVATSISRFMIDRVISDMRTWLDEGHAFGHVAVNAAAAEFRNDGFAESVLERLQNAGVPTRHFQLEVTETVFLGKGAEYVDRALKLLDSEGVRIALDDFGTGYASLRHLKQFPVHVIKIDQGFVQGMNTNPEDEAIISAVLNLGKSLSIDVVAEGIETAQQEARLIDLGCPVGQGYLYSKAIPAAELPNLIKDFTQPVDIRSAGFA